MQDVVSSTALFEHDDQDSKITDVSYESESRSQTSASGKRRPLSRQEAFRQTNRRPSRRTEYDNDWQGSMKVKDREFNCLISSHKNRHLSRISRILMLLILI